MGIDERLAIMEENGGKCQWAERVKSEGDEFDRGGTATYDFGPELRMDPERSTIQGDAMASANVLQITDENFEAEVMQSDKPVLLDFFTQWCNPCKQLAPTIEELAEEYKGKVKFGKVDVTDGNRRLGMQFKIESIPTLVVINKGQVVWRKMGALPKKMFKEALDPLVGAAK